MEQRLSRRHTKTRATKGMEQGDEQQRRLFCGAPEDELWGQSWESMEQNRNGMGWDV